jgi:hypothetical protein
MHSSSPLKPISGRTCFISAPAGTALGVLRTALELRGLRVLVPHDLTAGTDWASEIHKQLSLADFVVGVLTSDRQSPWVLFELGQAWALGRQIVLITPPGADPIPFVLPHVLVLRTDLNNQEAIGFALDQVLAAPGVLARPAKAVPASVEPRLAGLGDATDLLHREMEQAAAARDYRRVEQLVAEALRSSGSDVVVQSPGPRDMGVDLAVWSDVLEPFVGNPLLIEVKYLIRGTAAARDALHQMALFIGKAGARWGLLLYGEGPAPDDPVWAAGPPNVLVLPLSSLLDELRTRAFPELIRDLRNKRVHGSIA